MLNTDAEGRLVLADALAYADAQLDPDVLVDMATLTGAVAVALGQRSARSSPPTTSWPRQLGDAGGGQRASGCGGCRWSRTTAPALDSDVADLANIASGPISAAGSITAALFLRQFSGGPAWAHLDIAGAGDSAGDGRRGTTGRPASAPGCCSTGCRALTLRWRHAPGGRRPSRCMTQGPAGRRWQLRLAGQRAAVADRQQQRDVAVVGLATACPSSRIATVSASRCAGSATRSCQSALSNATTPPGRSSRSASLEVVGVLLLVAVAEDQVVGAVGEPRQHLERARRRSAAPGWGRCRPR